MHKTIIKFYINSNRFRIVNYLFVYASVAIPGQSDPDRRPPTRRPLYRSNGGSPSAANSTLISNSSFTGGFSACTPCFRCLKASPS